MGFRITFVVDVGEGDLFHNVLNVLLDALYQNNCDFLRANPNTPRLYSDNLIAHKKRIHYELEEAGHEDWQDIPTTLALGTGDCEDLACWRAAELTVLDNIPARPFFTVKQRANGGMLYHIRVKVTATGAIEDPSKKLGM